MVGYFQCSKNGNHDLFLEKSANRIIPLYMDSNDISTVSEHKHLGLVILDNGSLEKHIDMITGKAYKRINILNFKRKFRFILDRKIRKNIFYICQAPIRIR